MNILHNLSFRNRKALKDLQCHPGLVIKPADKGGNVLMDVGVYERMCLDILDNRQKVPTYIEDFSGKLYTQVR